MPAETASVPSDPVARAFSYAFDRGESDIVGLLLPGYKLCDSSDRFHLGILHTDTRIRSANESNCDMSTIDYVPSGPSFARLLGPIALLWRYRQILRVTTWNDIRARYAGSAFGMAWLMLYPMLLLGTYAAVYIQVFKIRFALFDSNEYVALIFCGLIPFLAFSEALGTGVGSVTGNVSLVRNTLFPLDLIPVKGVLTSQGTQMTSSILLVIALLWMHKLTFWALLAIPIWVAQLAFTIGLLWILSSLNVYFRDLQNMVAVLTLVLMMVSPIAYTQDMVPENLRWICQVNPLYYLIVSYQSCLMLGQCPPPEILATLFMVSFGMFFLGYVFFQRMKMVFADNL
jgi:lipopolysaccharide transport system permease protein